MKRLTIGVVDYGAGNLASVARAITGLGHRCRVTRDTETLAAADAIVLPRVLGPSAGVDGPGYVLGPGCGDNAGGTGGSTHRRGDQVELGQGEALLEAMMTLPLALEPREPVLSDPTHELLRSA